MANEAEIINNPDSTPGAVSTGYQLQNTNLIAQRAGIDLSYVSGGVGSATVQISGPIDVNGVLYNIKSAVILTPPAVGRYYITLQGAGPTNLTPTLGTSAGTFDALKNARYDASNYRVLNWVIYFDGTNCFANRLMTPENEKTQIEDLDTQEEFWITGDGTWVAPRTKYYTIYVTGRGGNGGNGGNGYVAALSTPATIGVIGGYAGSTGIKRILITAGTTWTATFTTGASATTFTDGTTTLSAGNQGGAVTGCDITFVGAGYGYGGRGGEISAPANGHTGDSGGASFWGSGGGGGAGGTLNNDGIAGGAAQSYGGGGGCGGGGGYNSSGTSSGGAGGAGRSGVIRIVG